MNIIADSLIKLNFSEKEKFKKNLRVNVCHLHVGAQEEQNEVLCPVKCEAVLSPDQHGC